MKKFTVIFKNFGSHRDDYRSFDTFSEAKKLADTIVSNGDAYDVRIEWSNDRDSKAVYYV